ncbi:MAG: prepilin-type N-terminal cleavage/methylation domain-containing protein [Gammaproteobacteria bacterium]
MRPQGESALAARALQYGATLVELVITIVIISISVAAVVGTLSRMTAHSADPMIEAQAVAIAESYLEEIMLKAYLDPTGAVCPGPPGSRSLYDNVCDYNGLVDIGARDQSGNPPPGIDLSAYTVTVTVDQTATLNNLSGSGSVLRIDVNVTYVDPSIADITLSGYRTNY